MATPSLYDIPWPTLPMWQAANQTMARTIQCHRGELHHLVSLARRIRKRISALDDSMETLCSHSCSKCQNVCCRHAHVYYDFKDLLYLHLAGGPLPLRQTKEIARNTCCYFEPGGCRLPRVERPFICTWYLCPEQQACLEKSAPSVMIFMHNSLIALKLGRKRLETDYLRAVTDLLRC